MGGFAISERNDSMAKDNFGLVSFAGQALAAGTGYVYGTFGQCCTAALLDQKARQYPADNLAGGPMRTAGNRWLGRRVVDCIGLIKYYLMADKIGDNPTYLQQYDCLNADDLLLVAKESGPISALPEIPGLLLHMPGHVGIYVGNGYAIEAAGTEIGVVKTQVKNRGWDHWYKCIWIDYVQPEAIWCDTTKDFSKPVGATYQFASRPDKVTCGSGKVWKQISVSRSGSNYLTKFQAIKKGSAGFYVNGVRQCVGTVN